MTRAPALRHLPLLLFAGALTAAAEDARADDEVRHGAARELAQVGGGRASSAPAAPTSSSPPAASIPFMCHALYVCDSYRMMCIIPLDAVALILLWMVASWYQHEAGRKHQGTRAVGYAWLGCSVAVLLIPAAVLVSVLVTCGSGRAGQLAFVHIPKNAGSAVEEAGFAAHLEWSKYGISFYGKHHMPDGSYCNSYHIPPWMYRSPYEGATVFCITRHPFERAVSEYTWMADSNAEIWRQDTPLTDKIGLYSSDRRCTAAGLNEFIRRTSRLYMRGQKYLDDCHHIPQSEFVWDYSTGKPGEQMCTEVLRIGDLDREFDDLMGRYGYKGVHLAAMQENPSEASCNVSAADLDEESKSLLREIYADDFRLLNYSAY